MALPGVSGIGARLSEYSRMVSAGRRLLIVCMAFGGDWRFDWSAERGGSAVPITAVYIVRIIKEAKNRLGAQIFENIFVMGGMAQRQAAIRVVV